MIFKNHIFLIKFQYKEDDAKDYVFGFDYCRIIGVINSSDMNHYLMRSIK